MWLCPHVRPVIASLRLLAVFWFGLVTSRRETGSNARISDGRRHPLPNGANAYAWRALAAALLQLRKSDHQAVKLARVPGRAALRPDGLQVIAFDRCAVLQDGLLDLRFQFANALLAVK